MTAYKIKIDEDAVKDIGEISDWYNKRSPNLGSKFKKSLKIQINTLKLNVYSSSLRYNKVRCLVMKKFPFLIHYKIDEINNTVVVFAVIHTSRNPDVWNERDKKN